MTMMLRTSRWLVALMAAALVLPAPVQAQQKITLKLNLGTPPGNPYNVGADEFKKIVEADTKGAITVQIFPMAQLGGETESAKNVGTLLGDRAKAKGVTEVVFDRGGYRYHGRVKALADGVRAAGVKV